MTIKELAREYGVSTQAVYKRIAKAGKSVKELTTGQTGELTEEGRDLLATLFTNQQTTTTNQSTEVERLTAEVERLKKEVERLKKEVENLQTRLNDAQLDKDRLYTLLAAAQQTAQALTVARLAAPAERKTFAQRVRSIFTQEKEG